MSGPLAGAYGEYDARVGVTGATNVTQWDDQSGNARHLNLPQATPKTNTRKISGQNAILFGGNVNDGMAIGSVSFSPPYTIIAVVQSDQTNFADGFVWTNDPQHGTLEQNATNWKLITGVVGGKVDNFPHVLTGQINGASSLIRVDGAQIATGTVNAHTVSTYSIGGDGGGHAFSGVIGHVFMYTSALSAADMVLVEQYLATQWLIGLQAGGARTPRIWTPQGLARTRPGFADLGDKYAIVTNGLTEGDTGSGADAGESIAVTLSDGDTGAGVDAGESLAVALSTTETATGTDAGESLAVTTADTDTGSGADAEGTTATSDSDTGAATDAGEAIAAALSDTETAAAVDADGTTQFSDDDPATADDAGEAITVALSDDDTGISDDDGLAEGEGATGYVSPTTSQPGGRKNFEPSRETQDYWERERRRISTEAELAAILADDEEVLVLM